MPEPTGTTTTSAGSGEPAGGSSTRAAHESRDIVVSTQEKNGLVMRLVAEHGTVDNALLKLAGKQIRYQKRAQEAERQAAELRKLIPGDGAVVLTGDQAKAFAKLKEMNVDFGKLPDTLKEHSELRTQVTAQGRKTDVATAAGKKWKPSVLMRLLGDSADGKIEFKDQLQKKEDGSGTETVRVAYITIDGKSIALDTWMETDQKEWLDVAKASETDGNGGGSGTSASSSATSTGATMPRQTATGSTTTGTPAPKTNAAAVDKVMKSKYKTPSQMAAESKK
jgi:hypothetical protein